MTVHAEHFLLFLPSFTVFSSVFLLILSETHFFWDDIECQWKYTYIYFYIYIYIYIYMEGITHQNMIWAETVVNQNLLKNKIPEILPHWRPNLYCGLAWFIWWPLKSQWISGGVGPTASHSSSILCLSVTVCVSVNNDKLMKSKKLLGIWWRRQLLSSRKLV